MKRFLVFFLAIAVFSSVGFAKGGISISCTYATNSFQSQFPNLIEVTIREGQEAHLHMMVFGVGCDGAFTDLYLDGALISSTPTYDLFLTEQGEYTVHYFDDYTINGLFTVRVEVLPASTPIVSGSDLATPELRVPDFFQLFPNPTTEVVNIRFNTTPETRNWVKLYDLNGRLVTAREATGEEIVEWTIDLTDEPIGLYLIAGEVRGQSFRYKVAKESTP